MLECFSAARVAAPERLRHAGPYFASLVLRHRVKPYASTPAFRCCAASTRYATHEAPRLRFVAYSQPRQLDRRFLIWVAVQHDDRLDIDVRQ